LDLGDVLRRLELGQQAWLLVVGRWSFPPFGHRPGKAEFRAAGVAHGGEAARQHRLQLLRRAGHEIEGRLQRQPGKVGGVGDDMNMRVDQAGSTVRRQGGS
jgi:hypothetical protein